VGEVPRVFPGGENLGLLVSLYEQDGVDMFEKLNGTFAVFLYDEHLGRFIVADDRYGEGLVYFTEHNGHLLFATSTRPFFRRYGIEPRLSLDGVNEYLSYRVVLPPRTIYAEISKLPQGHVLVAENGKTTVKRYWPIRDVSLRLGGSKEDLAREFRGLFKECVKARQRAAGTFGVTISGGIDSTLLAFLLSCDSAEPLKTFTLRAEHDQYRDGEFALRVADWLHTDHNEQLFTPAHLSDLDFLGSCLESLDEPVAMSFPNEFFINSFAAKSCQTIFNGALLPAISYRYPYWRGEPWRRSARPFGQLLSAVLAGLPHVDEDDCRLPAMSNLLRRARLWAEKAGESLEDALERPSRIYSDRLKRVVFSPLALAELGDRLPTYAASGVFKSLPFSDPYGRAMYGEVYCSSLSKLVAFNGVTHSIPISVVFPYLDTKLTDFALALPTDLKKDKKVLKLAFGQSLPEFPFTRRSEGMSVPYEWFPGPLKGFVEEVLLYQESPVDIFFNPNGMRRLIDRFSSGQWYYGAQIWALMVLKLWTRANNCKVVV
jgi:asparagine synthase (glutamine-hydrolysing)